MGSFVFKHVLLSLVRSKVFYVANTLSIAIIVLLFAYLDGSRRQMDLQSTVFSGEVAFNLVETDVPDRLEQALDLLRERLPGAGEVQRKLRTNVQYFLPGNVVGVAEVIGLDFELEHRLTDYLTLQSGVFPRNPREVLIPSSLLAKTEMELGDPLRVMGKTADETSNSARLVVCGVYSSPSLSLFASPRLLTSYSTMENFFQPRVKDVEITVSYPNGVPVDSAKQIYELLSEGGKPYAENARTNRASSFDIQNLSIQFNIFLLIMVLLTIAVIITVVFLVNFNVFLLSVRKRRSELGTLMAFGIRSPLIALALLFETFVMVLFAAIFAALICAAVSWVGGHQRATGSLEVLVVLLSGTNRIDFFLQPYQFALSFGLVLGASLLSQIQNFVRLSWGTPQEFLGKK